RVPRGALLLGQAYRGRHEEGDRVLRACDRDRCRVCRGLGRTRRLPCDAFVLQLDPDLRGTPEGERSGTTSSKHSPRARRGSRHARYASMIGFKWGEAENEFRRAIELSPDETTARIWYADLLMMTARMSAALREVRQALELDPLSARIWTQLGQWHWVEG